MMKDNPVEGLKSIYQQLLERDKKTEERHKRYKKFREQFDYVNNVHGYLRQQSENLSHQIAQKNLILATLITAEQQEIFDDQILTQNFNKIVQQKKQKQKELNDLKANFKIERETFKLKVFIFAARFGNKGSHLVEREKKINVLNKIKKHGKTIEMLAEKAKLEIEYLELIQNKAKEIQKEIVNQKGKRRKLLEERLMLKNNIERLKMINSQLEQEPNESPSFIGLKNVIEQREKQKAIYNRKIGYFMDCSYEQIPKTSVTPVIPVVASSKQLIEKNISKPKSNEFKPASLFIQKDIKSENQRVMSPHEIQWKLHQQSQKHFYEREKMIPKRVKFAEL